MKPDLYPVELIAPKRLFLMPRPRSGDSLPDEVDAWHAARIDLVVSLLEPDEALQLGLDQEARLCARQWIEFLSFPITDHGVPTSLPAVASLAKRITEALRDDLSVAIHCRAGIGRTGLVAACVLHELDVPFDQIFAALSKARGLSVPDTLEQVEWVQRYCAQGPAQRVALRAVR